MINSNMIIYIILAIIVFLIIISIVKKAVKLLITLITIFFLISAYNVFIKGVSPIKEVNGYVTNVKYGRAITEYSNKIKLSVDNIEKVVSNKNQKGNSLDVLKAENLNLHKYYDEVKILKHTEKLDSFHNKYYLYVKTIVESSDAICKVGNLTGEKNYKVAQETFKKIKLSIEELWKIGETKYNLK